MFVGHSGVSFTARPAGNRVPLWVWFIAVQWLDVIWSVLVLTGIEKLRIVRRFTQAKALDLYYMPSPMACRLDRVLARVRRRCGAVHARNRMATTMLVAAAAFSHWILDLVDHVPDLPVYDDTAKVGFGLWR